MANWVELPATIVIRVSGNPILTLSIARWMRVMPPRSTKALSVPSREDFPPIRMKESTRVMLVQHQRSRPIPAERLRKPSSPTLDHGKIWRPILRLSVATCFSTSATKENFRGRFNVLIDRVSPLKRAPVSAVCLPRGQRRGYGKPFDQEDCNYSNWGYPFSRPLRRDDDDLLGLARLNLRLRYFRMIVFKLPDNFIAGRDRYHDRFGCRRVAKLRLASERY